MQVRDSLSGERIRALALSPHLQRGALTVPGGFWSQMIWRSSNFSQMATFLSASYPDALDRQLLVALSQAQWDYTDPATYAPYVQKAPLPGSGGAKQLSASEQSDRESIHHCRSRQRKCLR